MINTETTTEKIARLLSVITHRETNIMCEFHIDEDGDYISEDLVGETGLVGKKLFSTMVLAYRVKQHGKYLVCNPSLIYTYPLGGSESYDLYSYDLRKDYIFDTEKETFLSDADISEDEPIGNYYRFNY